MNIIEEELHCLGDDSNDESLIGFLKIDQSCQENDCNRYNPPRNSFDQGSSSGL